MSWDSQADELKREMIDHLNEALKVAKRLALDDCISGVKEYGEDYFEDCYRALKEAKKVID